ncbi:MAG: cysteine--tRNA ligase [Dehalococcoidia bacterium]|nr:cysteine--tRNA ligase [Dehalococcoidia bacterium]
MKVYNTLSGHKEEFTSGDNLVKMYVCGVTPYDESHVGHAMSYIIFDAIKRYLEYRGYRVRHVQNFTDIDDKIINRAQRLGITANELAERFIQRYFDDMDALNIKRADVYPRATQEVQKIVEIVQGLIEKGHAYSAGGDVYFRVKSSPDYGKLSRRMLDGMMSGARVEVGESKEHPMDFTLWKAAKPGEPCWESPWSMGRPGWHIECTAMSIKYLGETLDIHGGGQDLIFPHHENEIAQSECFTGKAPFVRYWMHNGLMRLGEEKMSKSLGNLVTVRQMLDKYSADALRLFILSSHYRTPLTFSESGVAAMEKAVGRLRAALAVVVGQGKPIAAESYRQQFIEVMDDDFNTAQAVALLFDLARDINRGKEEGVAVDDAQRALRELGGVLGLTLAEPKLELPDEAPFIELLKQLGIEVGKPAGTASAIDALVEKRTGLRSAKQWADADQLRRKLAELNVVLDDTPQGTAWKYRGKSQPDGASGT